MRFLAGGSAPLPAGPSVSTSACANSSAAPLAVIPHDDPPPSPASASSMASAMATSPTALTRAYSSGSSVRRSSSRADKFAWGTTHSRMISLSAETAFWASSRASSVSPAHAASLVGLGSLVAERTDSRHAKASAMAASAAGSSPGSTPATPTHAPTMERNADESSIDAWRVTRALANRNARLAAIQSSSLDAVPSFRRVSVDREIDPTIDRIASPRRASGMYARTARNATLSAARLTLASSTPHIGTTCGAMTFAQSVSSAAGADSLAVAATRKY